ncbi:MAG: hypothetical protein C1943_11360 [Halochromatium sp.]|nr:hypothetical protein [Halochromatium sp.]
MSESILVENDRIAITVADVETERHAIRGLQRDQTEAVSRPEPSVTSIINTLYVRKTLADYATEQDLDEQDWVRARLLKAREKVLADAAVEYQRAKVLERLPEMEERARELYQANPDAYVRKPRVRVAHILMQVDSEACGEERFKEAVEIRERIIAGAAFADLARQYSIDDQSAKQGGELPWFGEGAMVPEFEEAAFALKQPGDVSEPVVTEYGIHLIKLLEREEGGQRSFEEIKDALSTKLQVDWLQAEVESWRSTLTDPNQARVNKDALDAYMASQQPAVSDQQP